MTTLEKILGVEIMDKMRNENISIIRQKRDFARKLIKLKRVT